MQVEKAKTLGPTGGDRVQFVMKANQGQTDGPVDAVASSGEKSRLLLLLETQLPPPQARSSFELEGQAFDGDTRAREDDVNAGEYGSPRVEKAVIGSAVRSDVTRASPCAVLYDEIDAHVGGRTAVAVGRLLANQGRKYQVRAIASWLVANCLFSSSNKSRGGMGWASNVDLLSGFPNELALCQFLI